MARIGVFLCWCGENIARTVDVAEVAKLSAEIPGVRVALRLQVHVLRSRASRCCAKRLPVNDWTASWSPHVRLTCT